MSYKFLRKWGVGFLLLISTLSVFSSIPSAFAQSDEQAVAQEPSIALDGFIARTDDKSLAEFEAQNDVGEGMFRQAQQQPAIMADPVLNRFTTLNLPIGQEAFKIEVETTGIYQLTYDYLVNAGMDTPINYSSLVMMHRGTEVAYQPVDQDSDGTLESGDSLLFYGEDVKKFNRDERLLLSYNVYWIWQNSTPTLNIASQANPTGYANDSSWLSTVTLEDERVWISTWTNNWALFPNEPDMWFMDQLIKADQTTLAKTYTVTLPNPASTGADATLTVEVNSRTHPTVSGVPRQNAVDVHVNGSATPDASDAWWSIRNRSILGSVPLSQLVDGDNLVDVVIVNPTQNTSSGKSYIYPNRITFNYQRQYVADNNQLIYYDESAGNKEANISGFTESDYSNFIVWNVTNPYQPVAITIGSSDLSAGTLRVGTDFGADNDFIATTNANVLAPASISAYTASDITPVGGAKWLAISHADFLSAANTLATHRQDPLYGGLTTHVVDVADIFNQVGFGLPLPSSIRDYLAESLSWSTSPRYVTLVGDATMNPRQLDCEQTCKLPNFNNHETNYVPTIISFVDRFQGAIPTDSAFTMLTGNDAVQEMPIGRLAVQTLTEANQEVNKIINYEQNQLTPQAWMENILFVSDNADSGGDFCTESQNVGNSLPASLNQIHLCQDNMPVPDLQTAMYNNINNGTAILNYRGHGAINRWAGGPVIMNTSSSHQANWTNSGKPVVAISADCLDGYFAYPGWEALSETYMQKNDSGTAAHWSSTGLGYSGEHNILHANFYAGIFDEGYSAIGDAIQYAKGVYASTGNDVSELYAFTLQGDPAMQLMRPAFDLDKTAPIPAVEKGGTVDFVLTLHNAGIYPIGGIITDTIPTGFEYIAAVSNGSLAIQVDGSDVYLTVADNIGLGESATVTLTLKADISYSGPNPATNNAALGSLGGIEADLSDNDDTADVYICSVAPPALPNAGIDQSGANVLLSWGADANASVFEVHRATDAPYFAPTAGSLIATKTGTTHTDAGKIGQPANNYYYLIQAVGCSGGAKVPSQHVGEFDFAIVPGT